MGANPTSYFIWADLFRKKRAESSQALTLAALRENQLFRSLTEKELQYLANMVYLRAYEKGEEVFRQRERGFGLYIIVEGTIAIHTLTSTGDVPVTQLGKGSFFGELALIEEDNIRSATAVPLERTLLIGFFKPDLMELVRRKPGMGVKILLQLSAVLGRRLMETNERIG